MNSFYTIKTKTFKCPMWGVDVKVAAKYRLREDNKTAYFIEKAECDILKNLGLPKKKRNPKFEMLRYCNMIGDCPCLRDFDKEITVP